MSPPFQRIPLDGTNLDFAILASDDEYAKYYNLLAALFGLIGKCYTGDEAGSYEAGVVPGFLKRLHTTVELLRLKYTHRATASRSLLVDLTDSGFPSAEEIHNIVQDLLSKKDRLRALPVRRILKRELLDSLLQRHKDDPEVLWQLSEREYLERLDEGQIFLPFTSGQLVPREVLNEGERRYAFSWGCYDYMTNIPYLHIMTVSQDANQEPLEQGGATWHRFLEVVKTEGSRAPTVDVLAMMIDDAIEWLHPKVIKRVALGPLYSPILFADINAAEESKEQAYFRKLFGSVGCSELDFIVFITDDVIFSKNQQISRSILSPRGRIREIFAIDETDPACFRKRASVVNQHILLPHSALQEIRSSEIEEVIPGWGGYRKITYDKKGRIEINGRS